MKHQLMINGITKEGKEVNFFTFDSIENAKKEFNEKYPESNIKGIFTSD